MVFDDFRPQHLEFPFLLRLLDRYPLRVEVKGGTTTWSPRTIIITTPQDPTLTYFAHTREDLAQLTRRISRVHEFPKDPPLDPPSPETMQAAMDLTTLEVLDYSDPPSPKNWQTPPDEESRVGPPKIRRVLSDSDSEVNDSEVLGNTRPRLQENPDHRGEIEHLEEQERLWEEYHSQAKPWKMGFGHQKKRKSVFLDDEAEEE